MTPLLAVFAPGPLEIIVVAGVALLLFGGRLPSVARNIGRSVLELRRGFSEALAEAEEFESVIAKQDAEAAAKKAARTS